MHLCAKLIEEMFCVVAWRVQQQRVVQESKTARFCITSGEIHVQGKMSPFNLTCFYGTLVKKS